ncbi:SDR family oxidoreductase [Salinisphaera sp.]|uniref:SDR family NAD(P)-dependent oxidoreductase n=1 Tax=Salinisphaera sp. TaxID=1914330 RepID=UPI002D7730EB|nr:SDR family oxidoreductase [Salinisphaera sp.]HET7315038.1 SDR family oxidoreductase [Salinisphaera sp.]
MSNATSSPFALDGLTAIVTGASKGIGRATALRLARAGADVGLIARSETNLREVASLIEDAGQQAFVAPCDIRDIKALRDCFEHLPVPDVFINNAGRNQPQHFLQVDREAFDAMLELNVRSAFFAAQSAARRMRAADKTGVIVNLSSQAGHTALIKRSVYCATKHAMEGMTKSMALELAPAIRVVSVAPTFVKTEMTQSFLETDEYDQYMKAHLLTRQLATVDDVANAVLYAASPAANMMTGTSLVLDGGWTAH